MAARKIIIFCVLSFIASVFCLDLQRLADDCLTGRPLQETQEVQCVTNKSVAIKKIQQENQTFYCISYEKKDGDSNEFDILSFNIFEDYDLKYVSVNQNLTNLCKKLQIIDKLF